MVARGNWLVDGMLAAGSACALVGSVLALDNRVRDFAANALGSDPMNTLTSTGMRAQHMAHTLMASVGYRTEGNEILLMFAAVGAVFLVLMFKS